MRLFLIAGLIVFAASSAASGLPLTRIADDLERGMAIEARPSWRIPMVRQSPLRTLALHRRWAIAAGCQAAALVVMLLVAMQTRVI